MNEQLQNLIRGVGIMTELWIVTYNGFRKQGITHSEALEHTGAFMKVMIAQYGETGGTE